MPVGWRAEYDAILHARGGGIEIDQRRCISPAYVWQPEQVDKADAVEILDPANPRGLQRCANKPMNLALGSGSFPISTFANDAKADTLATAAKQTTSSVTWTTTGLTTPVKQKLSKAVTISEKGLVRISIKLAKASTTMYVCPKIAVS